VPTDPTKSLRSSFREIILKDTFNTSVRAINTAEDGQPWLTDGQLEELYDELTTQPSRSLVEANEASRTAVPRPGRCQ